MLDRHIQDNSSNMRIISNEPGSQKTGSHLEDLRTELLLPSAPFASVSDPQNRETLFQPSKFTEQISLITAEGGKKYQTPDGLT